MESYAYEFRKLSRMNAALVISRSQDDSDLCARTRLLRAVVIAVSTKDRYDRPLALLHTVISGNHLVAVRGGLSDVRQTRDRLLIQLGVQRAEPVPKVEHVRSFAVVHGESIRFTASGARFWLDQMKFAGETLFRDIVLADGIRNGWDWTVDGHRLGGCVQEPHAS